MSITSAGKKLARLNPYCPAKPNFTSNNARIYFRPYVLCKMTLAAHHNGTHPCQICRHLEKFLSILFDNFTVAAWTSAQPQNAVPMAKGVFGNHFEQLAFVWDRSQCSAVREGRVNHTSIKDMNKVWNCTGVSVSVNSNGSSIGLQRPGVGTATSLESNADMANTIQLQHIHGHQALWTPVSVGIA